MLALTGSGLAHRDLREHSSGRETLIRGGDMERLYIKRVLGFIHDSQVVFPAPPEGEVMWHRPHQPLKTFLTITYMELLVSAWSQTVRSVCVLHVSAPPEVTFRSVRADRPE